MSLISLDMHAVCSLPFINRIVEAVGQRVVIALDDPICDSLAHKENAYDFT